MRTNKQKLLDRKAIDKIVKRMRKQYAKRDTELVKLLKRSNKIVTIVSLW